jgi:hypothetical protein
MSKEDHERLMAEVQEEWETNKDHHMQQRHINVFGIRSSQISALVAVLMKKGVLKPEKSE